MTNKTTTIPCPVCNNGIELDTYRLLQGEKFVCKTDGCNSVIALSNESNTKVQEAMNKLEDLKNRKNND